MAAYYPSTRHRQTTLSHSFGDDKQSKLSPQVGRSTDERQHSADAQESFLIFPEPLGHAQGPSLPVDHRTRKASVATTTAPPASLPSPTSSSWSLQTSLLASVEAQSPRSEIKDIVHVTRPERSESRSRSRSLLRDWEEVPNRRPLPRGRQGIPLSTDERGVLRRNRMLLEQRGSGWAWTLDDDDEQEGMLIDAQNSPTGSERLLLLVEETGRGSTRYEDASESLDTPRSGDPEDSTDLDVEIMHELQGRYRAPQGTTGDRRRQLHLTQERRPRYSFRLSSQSDHQSQARSSTRRNAGFPLPFGTLLQALFAIDQSTMQLIQDASPSDPSSLSTPRSPISNQTSIFGLTEDVLKPSSADIFKTDKQSHARSITQLEYEHELSQGIRLFSRTSSESENIVANGISATHVPPTNPFSFPLYVLNLGWELGLKAFQSTAQRER